MKKLFCILFIAVSSIALHSRVYAQFSAGGGLAYGFDIEEAGIQLNGTYNLDEKMRVGGDIIYWLVGDEELFGESFSSTFLEVNANFNYIFYDENELRLYGIGTLGVHYAKISIDIAGYSESGTDTELGVGLGAGLEYDLGNVALYAEPRVFLSGFDQLALAAGVRVPF